MTQSLSIPLTLKESSKLRWTNSQSSVGGYCLDLNATKELVIDFRHGQFPIPTLEEWSHTNTSAPQLTTTSPSNQTVKSSSSNVSNASSFWGNSVNARSTYQFFIEYIITFNITAWFGVLRKIHLNPLNKIIKMSSKNIDLDQEPLSSI